MATKEVEQRSPPYIPWKSFENYVLSLKGTTVPHTLDNTVKPRTMAGGLWRQVLSALRFLDLTSDGNISTADFAKLVQAHGTDQWAAAVKEHVVPAYDDIVGNLPIENATPGQLQARFKEKGGVEGQVLRKCVRFYIHALKISGTKYSSHFAMREEGNGASATRTVTAKKKKKQASPETVRTKDSTAATDDNTPTGSIDFPIPIGTTPKASFIRVPSNITDEQMPLVQAIMGVVQALAAQNSKKGKK